MTAWNASHPEPWDNQAIAWAAACGRFAEAARAYDTLDSDDPRIAETVHRYAHDPTLTGDRLLSDLLAYVLDAGDTP